MTIRLYFDRCFPPFKHPSRISITQFNDTSRHPSDLPISCEVSANKSWGTPQWKEVGFIDRAEHLVFALHLLADQHLLAKEALSMKVGDTVKVCVADNCQVALSVCQLGTTDLTRFWNLNLEFHKFDLSVDVQPWADLRMLHPFPHEHLLREAIVRLLRKEVDLKAMYDLEPTARFADLLVGLRKTGGLYKKASSRITSLEPFPTAPTALTPFTAAA